ncbi:MAG TPA: decaprenylphospho-beta-D-erythro-pentofuranosid-2-ulose 2-reductase [Marmoricola sp.]|nr:decaprenylphospho-beta-D-erythro-pentofuranosid-2-ulose 2-reductase [Marmoricola sp.]
MIDALGQPGSVLVLGGTSDIALATVELWLRRGPVRVELAARPGPRRDDAVRRLREAGADVRVHDFEAEREESHPALLEEVVAAGDIDVALVAFGVLRDDDASWQDHEEAVRQARINYLAAVSLGVLLGGQVRRQGHGVIVALSSVAGERVRRSNFVYGSTKAGMDAFYLGLGEALRGSGGRVLVVRPGFVRTKMTAGRDEAPLAVDAATVAEAIVAGVAGKSELIWVPRAMRGVMSGLRHVPRPLFRRLPI